MPISRAMSELLGKPLPKDNFLFKNDSKISKMITRCENYVEISLDLKSCMYSIKALEKLVEIRDVNTISTNGIYLSLAITIESYSCYIIMLYSKAFGTSKGRTSLDNKLKEVFNECEYLLDTHGYIMELRHKYFAHHQLKANTHSIFYKVIDGEVLLDPFCFSSKVEIYSVVPWLDFYKCIKQVKVFAETEAEKICKKIQDSLTESQRDYLRSVDYDEVISIYENSQKDLLSDR